MSWKSKYTEVRAARKQHKCACCWEPIEIGQNHVKWDWTSCEDDHVFGTDRFHLECHLAIQHAPKLFRRGDGSFDFDDMPYVRGGSRRRGEDNEHRDQDREWFANYNKQKELMRK